MHKITLGDMRRFTISKLIDKYTPAHQTIIDAGCGRGEFIRYMLNGKKNINFIGLDYDMEELVRSKETCARVFID